MQIQAVWRRLRVLPLVAAACVVACDAWDRASGTVVDAAGVPVSHAMVILSRDSTTADTARTNAVGRFSLMSGATGVRRGTVALRACTPGKQSDVVTVTASGPITISGLELILRSPDQQSDLVTATAHVRPQCP